MVDSSFTGNSLGMEGRGAGLYIESEQVSVVGSTFVNNTGYEGVGLYTTGHLRMDNCMVSDNQIGNNEVCDGRLLLWVSRGLVRIPCNCRHMSTTFLRT